MSIPDLNKNPFVKQMGEGPVSWHLWGEDTVKKARDLDRPICLCIMNNRSRWSRETKKHFNNEEIVRLLNNDFISVMADSDDAPHLTLAARVMAQLMMGHSGWPLFIFMTPEKKPIFASSYMPEQSNDPRMPGLLEVLRRIKWLWLMKRSQINEAAESYGAQLAETLKPYTGSLHQNPAENAASQILEEEDLTNGGIGTFPKFPQVPKLLLAACLYRNNVRKEEMAGLLKRTLSSFFAKGLYDHVGGGFHDYCCDSKWEQPYLGRHLGQNAAVLDAFLEVYKIFRHPLYCHVFLRSAVSLVKNFGRNDGLLYSGDDVGKTESINDYYLWSRKKICEILGSRGERFCDVYNIGTDGKYTDPLTQKTTGKSIPLLITFPDMKNWDEKRFSQWTSDYKMDLDKLADDRDARRPAVENKISVKENAIFAGVLAKASAVLEQSEYYSCAEKIMTELLRQSVSEDMLFHALYDNVPDGMAVLDDFAAIAWGCLQLYGAGTLPDWLDKTKYWCRRANDLFGNDGAYRLVPEGTSEILPAWDAGDDYLPSGNGIMANCLLCLYEITGEAVWKLRAKEIVQAFGGALNEYPAACASLMTAVLKLRSIESSCK